MLKITITSVILFMTTLINAQTIVASYLYDANGNRTKAVVVFLDQSSMTIPDPVVDTMTIDDHVLSIIVYPNPTVGTLRVVIPNNTEITNNEGVKLTVHNLQGGTIIQTKTFQLENILDLSGQPNGVYLLRVELYGKSSVFKIIKKG